MPDLQHLVDAACAAGGLPGAVALVARGDEVEVACAGVRRGDGDPMTRDAVFRIASLTKPILAAATLALAERGAFGLDDPVATWLPELADPVVLRSLDGPLDDVVPARRAITVRDLLTFRAGHGMPERFDVPVVQALVDELGAGPPRPQERPGPDEWMRRLATIPLLHQPGEGWTYDVGADVLGVLLSRVTGGSLGDVLSDTVLTPIGMSDTGFWAVDPSRLVDYHRRGEAGLELVDPPDGQWASAPPFESGGGGLVSTADDWWAFGRMLLAGGEHAGRRVLTPASVRQLMTPHHDGGPEHLFLDGQAWGFGGAVDIRELEPWHVLGRYGWVGGTGTAGYVVPSTDTVVVWLSQVDLGGPDDAAAMMGVLAYAARA
jgi:CubicO group peptidase (beta-lactamase class C family)